MRHTVWLAVACLALGACAGTEQTPRAATTVVDHAGSTTSTTTADHDDHHAPDHDDHQGPDREATRSHRSRAAPKPSAAKPRTSLKGDTNDAFAFAPLSNPGNVTVEGSVSSYKAWSTSKVLVVAAFLDTACDGDPGKATAQQKRWVTAALTASDMNAVHRPARRHPRQPRRRDHQGAPVGRRHPHGRARRLPGRDAVDHPRAGAVHGRAQLGAGGVQGRERLHPVVDAADRGAPLGARHDRRRTVQGWLAAQRHRHPADGHRRRVCRGDHHRRTSARRCCRATATRPTSSR